MSDNFDYTNIEHPSYLSEIISVANTLQHQGIQAIDTYLGMETGIEAFEKSETYLTLSDIYYLFVQYNKIAIENQHKPSLYECDILYPIKGFENGLVPTGENIRSIIDHEGKERGKTLFAFDRTRLDMYLLRPVFIVEDYRVINTDGKEFELLPNGYPNLVIDPSMGLDKEYYPGPRLNEIYARYPTSIFDLISIIYTRELALNPIREAMPAIEYLKLGYAIKKGQFGQVSDTAAEDAISKYTKSHPECLWDVPLTLSHVNQLVEFELKLIQTVEERTQNLLELLDLNSGLNRKVINLSFALRSVTSTSIIAPYMGKTLREAVVHEFNNLESNEDL